MITRHHIVITVLCALIVCTALVPYDPLLILIVCAGAATGSILPDIQMKRPGRTRARTIAWAISRFSRIIHTPLICRLYSSVWGRTCDPADKRLTHSIPGILSLWGILAVSLLIPAYVFAGSTGLYLAAILLCGAMLGLVLHLIEDMCTRKGITPLFPFSTTLVSGSIRPCDTTDRRIAQYQFYDCSMACILLGFHLLGNWQGGMSVPLSLFGLGSCLAMMIWSSDVSITREPVERPAGLLHLPVASDPFVRTWREEHPAPGLIMGVYYLNHPCGDL
jgi:membrane-bound metal-dependent hydrolase YbcI (DUF457 family)